MADLACPRCQADGRYDVRLSSRTDLSCAACGTLWRRGPFNEFVSVRSPATGGDA